VLLRSAAHPPRLGTAKAFRNGTGFVRLDAGYSAYIHDPAAQIAAVLPSDVTDVVDALEHVDECRSLCAAHMERGDLAVYRNNGKYLLESPRALYQFATPDALRKAIDNKLRGRAVRGSEI
jgi:hypothetical protein